MEVLVTGGAGFIGSHLADRLLQEGIRTTVLDSFDGFYDPAVKRANVAPHLGDPRYRLVEADIRDTEALEHHLPGPYDVVLHLAAKAGVRPSIADPASYYETNVRGTQNVLELARERGARQFVFASSSSVYGVNPRVPWSESDHMLLPISPYASTKLSGELLGHVYSHLYGMRFIACRLFTVYGPRQRPDLAIHRFTDLLLAGQSIPLYGDGSTSRDYTYVADVVGGLRAAMDYDGSPYEVINIGGSRPVALSDLVRTLEESLGVKAGVDWLPDQPGDVPRTWADVEKARRLLGYRASVSIQEGIRRFCAWRTAERVPTQQAARL